MSVLLLHRVIESISYCYWWVMGRHLSLVLHFCVKIFVCRRASKILKVAIYVTWTWNAKGVVVGDKPLRDQDTSLSLCLGYQTCWVMRHDKLKGGTRIIKYMNMNTCQETMATCRCKRVSRSGFIRQRIETGSRRCKEQYITRLKEYYGVNVFKSQERECWNLLPSIRNVGLIQVYISNRHRDHIFF